MNFKKFFEKEKKDFPKTAISLGAVGLMLSSFILMNSIHTIDTSVNMLMIFSELSYCYEKVFNATPNTTIWKDIGSDYVERDYKTIYIMGFNQLRVAFFTLFISTVVFCYGISKVKSID